jgi:hypothetical protein
MIVLPSGTVKLTLGPRLRGGMDAIINDVEDSVWMEEEERAIEGAEQQEGERRAKKRKSRSRALELEKYDRQPLSVARGLPGRTQTLWRPLQHRCSLLDLEGGDARQEDGESKDRRTGGGKLPGWRRSGAVGRR